MHLTLLVFIIATLFLGYFLLPFAVRLAYRAPRRVETGSPADAGLPYRTISIPTENARQLFSWYIPPPAQAEQAPAVVAMHGWGSNAELMLPFAKILHQAGYATLLVDARNHGRSDADSFSSLPRFAEDLEHAFNWIQKQPEIDSHKIALLGHSVGGGAALLVASRRNDAAAVVSIAAFAHPELMMRRHMRSNHIPYALFGWAVLHYIESAIGVSFDTIAPVNTIQKIHCPVLLIHGRDDRSVPHSDAEAIYQQRAHRQVKLLTLHGAGHNSIEHIESHGNELISFLHLYL
ncbi:MAG: alpha/beta fold hydrolase [Pseudomonadota bacterium]